MKLLKYVAVLLFVAVVSASAAGAPLLREDKVTLQSVKTLMADEYEMNIVGTTLQVYNGSLYVNIRVDQDRSFIRIYALWGVANDISDARAFKLTNNFNRDKILSKAFFSHDDDQDNFWLEIYMSYKGGIVKESLKETLDWFFVLCKQYDALLREEDVF